MGHGDRQHARLGGSTAHRWVNCYGSVALSEQVPKTAPSEDALRGTYVHEACEAALQDFLNYKITGEYTDHDWASRFDEEAADIASSYVKVIWEKVLNFSLTGKAWGIEEEVCLDKSLEMWGIVDFWAVYTDEKAQRVLVIVDFKNGFHFVEVAKNAQLLFYAAGMVKEIREGGKDFDSVRTCIYQPRIPSGEPFREATYSIKQLDSSSESYFKAARAILEGSGKLKVGSWCDFCPAQAICPAYIKKIEEQSSLALLKADLLLPKIDTIPDDTLAKLVLSSDAITSFLGEVEKYAILRAKSGNSIKGLKLIDGPTRRTWRDEEEKIAETLVTLGVKNPWNKKLIPITQAEKVTGKEALRALVTTTKPTVQLVADSDPRPALANALDILGETSDASTQKNDKL